MCRRICCVGDVSSHLLRWGCVVTFAGPVSANDDMGSYPFAWVHVAFKAIRKGMAESVTVPLVCNNGKKTSLESRVILAVKLLLQDVSDV